MIPHETRVDVTLNVSYHTSHCFNSEFKIRTKDTKQKEKSYLCKEKQTG